MDIAADMGMAVEHRPIKIEELATFDEVGACGTGAIITPIKKIVDNQSDKVYEYCRDGNVGPITQKLYRTLLDIQYGVSRDTFGWVDIVDTDE
jgi:branched-chain amino acid aminotransferase